LVAALSDDVQQCLQKRLLYELLDEEKSTDQDLAIKISECKEEMSKNSSYITSNTSLKKKYASKLKW